MTKNEPAKGNRRFFAVASLGKARWYWVVWPSLGELQASQITPSHIAEGYEKTKDEAVEKALALAGNYAKWIAAKYARAYQHNTKAHTPPQGRDHRTPALQTSLGINEFLYRDIFDAASEQRKSVLHRVVRRTKNYVYVEQRPFTPSHGTASWLDDEPPTYRLDRPDLEQNGFAFIPASATLTDRGEPIFFNYERMSQQENELPACLKVLHLT